MTKEEIYTKSFDELLEEREKKSTQRVLNNEPETKINYNVGRCYIKSKGSVKAWHRERNLDY